MLETAGSTDCKVISNQKANQFTVLINFFKTFTKSNL